MLLLISFILELRIRSIRLMFQLGDLLIRLVDAVFPMMTEMPSGSLDGDLRLMRRLNRRIFLFDLMDFAMNAGSEGVTDLADVILCPERIYPIARSAKNKSYTATLPFISSRAAIG